MGKIRKLWIAQQFHLFRGFVYLPYESSLPDALLEEQFRENQQKTRTKREGKS